MKNIYLKLISVQEELKAPKNQYNSFGKYKYRSCEDILEGVKPVLKKHNATLFLKDEIVYVEGRYYIKAIATFVDCETGESVEATALAREEETKKGMDGSQITGTASSYARKYALNGLFLIDDTKDADTDAYKQQQEGKSSNKSTYNKPVNNTGNENIITAEQLEEISNLLEETNTNAMDLLNWYNKKNGTNITLPTADIRAYNILKAALLKKKNK